MKHDIDEAEANPEATAVTKRQRVTAEPGTLTATESVKLFQGPVVTILVGPDKTKHTLPKALAEYYSPVLQRAFNGGFKEAEEQTIHFPEESSRDMDLVFQWMCSDGTNVRLEEGEASNGEATISRWIDFSSIGDRLDLHGSGAFSAAKIKSIIADHYKGKGASKEATITKAEYSPISEQCIRKAIHLPVNHPVRSTFAEAVAPSFIVLLRAGSTSSYRFGKELDDLESFRSDLFLAIGQIYTRAGNEIVVGNFSSTHRHRRTSICQLTGTEIVIHEA